MHKVPLTSLEQEGLEAHHLPIGKPSQLSDCFRHGMQWVLDNLKSHWIDVSDKLPSSQKNIQVLAVMQHEGENPYVDVVWFWATRGFDQHPVKYWMPIPEDPEEI